MPPVRPTTTVRPSSRTGLGVRPGNHGERGERAGEREWQAQRRPTRCGARDARRELAAAGGRSEHAARSPRIVRRSRHDYPDGLLIWNDLSNVLVTFPFLSLWSGTG